MNEGDGKTVSQIQREAIQRLVEAGIESPALDARLLLAAAIGCDAAGLISRQHEIPPPEARAAFSQFLEERNSGRPVHRILGYREFFGRDFLLNVAALEPRPETELLVSTVLEDWQSNPDAPFFCDIGAGSGAISVTLLCELDHSRAIATDISGRALECTRQNAGRYQVSDRLDLAETDCLDGVRGPFDFIVSNPPYIASDNIVKLSREVREHDPLAALDGGADGLEIYRRIFNQARDRLKPGGCLYLETGYDQHDLLAGIATHAGWTENRRLRDLSGQPRVMVFSQAD